MYKNNTFIFCHNIFIIFETSEDNKTYKVLFSFYERFLFYKSLEFGYKIDNKYNIIIASIYDIYIFEKKENGDDKWNYDLIKKININEIVYNIIK